MTLAILCSGQGWQHSDMFALTAAAPEASSLFAHAAKLLDGRDPRDLVRNDPDCVLHRNRCGQILCTLQALAVRAALGAVMPDRIVVAGYSVGEVVAWGVGGLIGATDILDLVAQRAEAMDAATRAGDGLLFVRGLSPDETDRLCERCDVAIAIVNPGYAFVLGGGSAALHAAAEEAMRLRASRIVRLPVQVASHTRQLATASAAFRESLRRISVTPRVDTRILSGIDGASVGRIDTGLDKLAAQISQTMQWAGCLQGCVEAGATAFLELGPGRALSEMASGAYPDVPARSVDDFKTLQGVRTWLARHGALNP